MLFNSLEFFIFFPAFSLTYFLLKGRARLIFCVLASYFFYGWWDWRFVSLLVISTSIDFVIGRHLAQEVRPAVRRMYLVGSLLVNLGILGAFKYFDFFALSFKSLADTLGFSPSPLLLNVILPVGISFYTFQTLSYTIDIYRGTIKSAEPDFYRFAAYVAFFPQLVAGPIVRAAHLLPQMQQDHVFDKAKAWRGCELVAWGFFLKLCLADNAAQVVDPRFLEPLVYNSLDHLIGIVCFAFQIYGDFAGVSLRNR